jgi:hypothetical protein
VEIVLTFFFIAGFTDLNAAGRGEIVGKRFGYILAVFLCVWNLKYVTT